jgi:molybdopterin-guanine dinucleotide biosynthesis protein A
MTGIVLAGGESRRMGDDKAFLKIDGRPLIEHVLAALRQAAGTIIIVTNSPAAYASYDAEIVGDEGEKRGSLIGLYSGLLRSRDDYSIVVACDMPFLNPGLLSHMAGLAHGYDAVLPRSGDLVEPLHAVYGRHLLPVIKSSIDRDDRRIRSIFQERRIRYVSEEEMDRFDPRRRSFINLNTRKEYEEVTCSDLECRN